MKILINLKNHNILKKNKNYKKKIVKKFFNSYSFFKHLIFLTIS